MYKQTYQNCTAVCRVRFVLLTGVSKVKILVEFCFMQNGCIQNPSFMFIAHELFFDWSQCRSQSLTPALLHHYTMDYGYTKIHNCISQLWMLHLISSWSWCWPFFLEEQKYSPKIIYIEPWQRYMEQTNTKKWIQNKENNHLHEQSQFGIDCLFATQISENFSIILNMILVLHFILQFLKSRDLS